MIEDEGVYGMSLVGRQIGRYRILEQLGSGGMSVVYKGLDTALDREVAVKVLHPHLSGKEESRKRLAREAKAVARLHHPNILEVFDFGPPDMDAGAGAYLVTEYIRGQTLREFCTSERFDPPEIAAMVVHQLAGALAHAHQSGIIHRDLKPENVMVRQDGVLKLMDFGIAKILDREERMTLTGALVGSPAHMAPEIIEGHEASAAADVFSLGTMLYLFATSKLPFSGPNATATLKQIVDGRYQDPRQVSPRISDQLSGIIATCLAKDPLARYPHAGKLREALAGYLSSFGIDLAGPELAAFFAAPQVYRAQLIPKLVEKLFSQSEQLLSAHRPARSLAALNHLLALEPHHPGALERVQQMNLAQAKRRAGARRMRALGASALILVAVATAAKVMRWRETRAASARQQAPPPTSPTPDPLPPGAGEAPRAIAEPPPLASPSPAQPSPKGAPARTPSAPPATGRPVAASRPSTPAEPHAAQVVILVKPFGYIQLDRGPRSAGEASVHTLSAAVGRHRLLVGCDFCEETERTIDIKDEPGQQFAVVPELKPSSLSFDYAPPDAMVRIGDELRSAEESRKKPFAIRTPQGPKPGHHHVEYQVSAPGHAAVSGVAELPPGQSITLVGHLLPER